MVLVSVTLFAFLLTEFSKSLVSVGLLPVSLIDVGLYLFYLSRKVKEINSFTKSDTKFTSLNWLLSESILGLDTSSNQHFSINLIGEMFLCLGSGVYI